MIKAYEDPDPVAFGIVRAKVGKRDQNSVAWTISKRSPA
jgi:hypothetical protein